MERLVEMRTGFDDKPSVAFGEGWAQAREGALAPPQSRIHFCVPSHAGGAPLKKSLKGAMEITPKNLSFRLVV